MMEIRRVIKYKVEQFDQEKNIVYIRVEEGGDWIGDFPVDVNEIKTGGTELINAKVIKFLKRIKTIRLLEISEIPDDLKIEGIVEIQGDLT